MQSDNIAQYMVPADNTGSFVPQYQSAPPNEYSNQRMGAPVNAPQPDRYQNFDYKNATPTDSKKPSIVHGDYRLDNCMVGDDGHVVAVLDWEICTLGDPLADLGLLQVYWTGPNDDASAWTGSATTAEGFLDRAELVTRYAAVSGRDVTHLPFYVSFAYWKLACILEGVYARYLGGALGARDAAELEPFKLQVDAAAESAERVLEQMS